MVKIDDYKTPITPNWCPGCGNFAIWTGLKQALVGLKLEPHEVVLTFDIGCSGNGADKVNAYAFKSLHGRTIPVAMGIKLANPDLTVIATGGDGGIFEEGVNHLMWAARSNYDITAIMHNNQVFGLTTGQPTTTTPKGRPAKTAPFGVVEDWINPIHLALISNASFVARGFAGDLAQLTKLLQLAIKHKGFAFVDILQPCVTLNKYNTFEYFNERVYKLEDTKNYDSSNLKKAFEVSDINDEKIATGVIYKNKNSVPFLKRLPQTKDKKTRLIDEVKKYSIREHIKEFE